MSGHYKRSGWLRHAGCGLLVALLLQVGLTMAALLPVGNAVRGTLGTRPAWACGLAGGPTMLANENAAIPNPQAQGQTSLGSVSGIFAADFLIHKPITFTEDLSLVPSAPNKNLLQWQWNFGDGTLSNGAVVRHVYTRPGSFAVSVKIYEDIGKKWEPFDGSQVTVLRQAFSHPPVAVPVADQTEIELGQSVTLDATKSSANEGTLTRYDWNFGDGQVGEGVKVTHRFALLGRTSVVLVVTDSRGARGIGSTLVNIVPPRPVMIVSASPARVVPGGMVHFDASASHVAEADNRIVTYRWDFGDGSAAQLTSTPQIAHSFVKAGAYTVTVRGVDLQNSIGTARLKIQAGVYTPSPAGLFRSPYILASLGLLVLLIGSFAWYSKQHGKARR